MRRLAIGALLLAAMVAAPRVASAQAKKGDREVLIQGQEFSTVGSGSNINFGQGIFNIGVFISDLTEVGGGPSIQISGGGGSGVTTTVGFNGFGRRYFMISNPKVQPYVAAEIFEQDFSNASTSLFINGVGGIKDYLSQKTALDISGAYGFNTNNSSTGLVQFKVGVTFLF